MSLAYYVHYSMVVILDRVILFFFNDTATTEIYTLSLHDALPIYERFGEKIVGAQIHALAHVKFVGLASEENERDGRSEEHTSELQSQSNLVCRLLLEKKKTVARPRNTLAITRRIYPRACSP